MNPLRILVADDHEIVRRGLVSLLKPHLGWEICGEARDGREAVEKAKALRPDVVILDVGMPNLNGLEAARQMLHNNSYTNIFTSLIGHRCRRSRASRVGCGRARVRTQVGRGARSSGSGRGFAIQ